MTLGQTITITDFRLKYDVIDVVRFPSYEKVGDLSYSTNPLIIYLRDDKPQQVVFPSIRTMDLTESNFYFKSSDDDSSSSKSLLTMDSAVITSIVLLGMFVLFAGLSARLRAEKHAKEEKEEVKRLLSRQQRGGELERSVDLSLQSSSSPYSSSSISCSLSSGEEELYYSSDDVSLLKPPSNNNINLLSIEHVPYLSDLNPEDINTSHHQNNNYASSAADNDDDGDDDDDDNAPDSDEDSSSFDSSLDFELFQ